MKSDIFDLPAFFNGGRNIDPYLHFYSAGKSTVKNKVLFSQNMLCLLRQGTKQVFGQTSNAKIDNSEMLLLPSGSFLMSERAPQNDKYESILVFFSNQFLTEFCLKHRIQIPANTKSNNTVITLKKDDFIFNYETSLKLLEQMREESSLQKVKLEELLLYLLKKYPNQLQPFIKQALQDSSELKIKQAVLANIEKNITIDELAFLCNMSASSFKRHFSEVFQSTPKKYFTDNKMRRAQQLLQMNRRASDIYVELGYENLSSFSSEFKKHFGVSPKQFQTKVGPKAKVFEPLA